MARVAGGTPLTALLLAVSMTLIQFAIGTLNDLVDAAADAGRKPGKPIPSGLVAPRVAACVFVACAAGGLLLALAFSPWLAALAAFGLGIGAWYDLRAKGTTLSWLPLAIGIPLLPVYGWFGATGELPGMFLIVVPAAANAGAALAISNALVDMERDADATDTSIAIALGARLAGWLVFGLFTVVTLLAVGTALALGAPSGWVGAVAAACLVPLGGAGLGAVAARRPGTAWREVAWEVQAVGTGLVAVAWLGALSAANQPPLAV